MCIAWFYFFSHSKIIVFLLLKVSLSIGGSVESSMYKLV